MAQVGKNKAIVFISHQWKCREEPDPTGDDWKAATLAMECLAATYRISLNDIIVWIECPPPPPHTPPLPVGPVPSH